MGIFTKEKPAGLNGHAGRVDLGRNILNGGHGTAILEDKRRSAHQQLAEERRRIEQSLPDLKSLKAVAVPAETFAVVLSFVAHMDRSGRSVAKKIQQWFGRKAKFYTALFREHCQSKNIYRPVVAAEPVLNTVALFLVFFCIETAANSSIFYGLGRFPSAQGAVIFSGTLALINIGLAWAFGFLTLRNWNHSSEKVMAWSRRSLLPLAVGWLALHGGAVGMRLSENLDFRNLQFGDMELMDFFSSAMLVLIAVLTTTICVYKSYKRCGDVDAQLSDLSVECMEPQEGAANEADGAQEELDNWRAQADNRLTAVGAKLEADEAALNRGQVSWKQGNADLTALAERLKKSFAVSIAEASTKDQSLWAQSGPKHAGLEFSAHETSINWDAAGAPLVTTG